MPLSFPGVTAENLDGVSIRAVDHDGKVVVVRASHEVLQDHGLFDVQRVASGKYDNGQAESNGNIVVRNADFT